MFDLADYDLDFQPKTYWPEGFEPFVPEETPPPIHRVDKGGEVYRDVNGHWHYMAFSDEIVVATFHSHPPMYLYAWRDNEEIRFRYVIMEDADLQASPPFLKPGILTLPEPLTFGDLTYLLDFSVVDETDDSPDTLGLAAWLWKIDWSDADTRTGRLFTVNAAPKFSSSRVQDGG